MQLAAELGKTLLERNKELEATIRHQQSIIEDQVQEIQVGEKMTDNLSRLPGPCNFSYSVFHWVIVAHTSIYRPPKYFAQANRRYKFDPLLQGMAFLVFYQLTFPFLH